MRSKEDDLVARDTIRRFRSDGKDRIGVRCWNITECRKMNNPTPAHDRFQFRLSHLFILTTTVALIMGIAVRLISPEMFRSTFQAAPKLFLTVIASYAFLFGGWLVLRGPRFFRNWQQLRQRHRAVVSQRQILEQLAAERRETLLRNSTDEATPKTGPG